MFVQTKDLAKSGSKQQGIGDHALGVHLLNNQLRTRSDVVLKCVGFSCMRSRMIVAIKDELVSVRAAGPLNSIERSIDCTISETAEKGTICSLSRTSIKWEAAREADMDVAALDALCQAEIQYDLSEA
jgi:hypothetical protein